MSGPYRDAPPAPGLQTLQALPRVVYNDGAHRLVQMKNDTAADGAFTLESRVADKDATGFESGRWVCVYSFREYSMPGISYALPPPLALWLAAALTACA